MSVSVVVTRVRVSSSGGAERGQPHGSEYGDDGRELSDHVRTVPLPDPGAQGKGQQDDDQQQLDHDDPVKGVVAHDSPPSRVPVEGLPLG